MDNKFTLQKENRVKASDAFNEFMDCYLKADSSFRNMINHDVISLMLIKANTDEEFNRSLSCALDLIKTMSELRTRTE